MLTGIIIVSVIAIFALYDYLSTKNWQLVTSDTRNNAVFENRNKKYGAYQIRRSYNRQMILIILGLSFGVGGLYAASLGISHKVKKTKKVSVSVGPLTAELEKDPIEEAPEKREEVKNEPQAATLRFDQFKIVTDPQTVDTIEIPDGKTLISDVTKKGTDPLGGPEEIIPDDTKKPELITDGTGIVINVDEVAYFIGGDDAQMKFFIKNAQAPEEGSGTTRVKFVVSKDGSISRVTVKKKAIDCPECDEEAVRLVKAMPRWEPGKVNGIPVDSYFTIPITFR